MFSDWIFQQELNEMAHICSAQSVDANHYYIKNVIQLNEANNIRIIKESTDKVHP
jgi:hypothetical protein